MLRVIEQDETGVTEGDKSKEKLDRDFLPEAILKLESKSEVLDTLCQLQMLVGEDMDAQDWSTPSGMLSQEEINRLLSFEEPEGE